VQDDALEILPVANSQYTLILMV